MNYANKYYNESLWLKYANNHKGFVLEYDVNNLNNSKFNVKPSIFSMSDNNICFPLYPIYYSKDENGYDSTDYAGFIACCYLLEKMGDLSTIQTLVLHGNFMWATERVLLIKKWIHHYEEEWRMILNSKYRINNSAKPCIICKPSKIILGLNISDDDKKAVLTAAEVAGINSIEQMTINNDDKFTAKNFSFARV